MTEPRDPESSSSKSRPTAIAISPTTPEAQSEVTNIPSDQKNELNPASASVSGLNTSQRVFKKSSQNNKLTLYLASRDLVVTAGKIDKIQGVLLVDPEFLKERKVYGQVTLTFRYGREDEEVMGLKFSNEAIMSLAVLYTPDQKTDRQETTPLQEALMKRFAPNAHPFTMAVTPLAPPSVQLVPAKEYNGAPIGTSYDIRIFVGERPDEKINRKTSVRMGIRVIQGVNSPPPPRNTMYSVPCGTAVMENKTSMMETYQARIPKTHENEILKDKDLPLPQAAVEKQFLLSDGRVRLEANLDHAIYAHGNPIVVLVNVTNNSNKSVRRIEASIIQHVDVCMFSNGKFKNIVAKVRSCEGCPVDPGFSLSKTFTLKPEKSSTKNWIALEDSYANVGTTLASTVISSGNGTEDRNVFAIYVSYYVKVKLIVSPIGDWIGGSISLKLPFTLMHSESEPETASTPSPTRCSPTEAGDKKSDRSPVDTSNIENRPDEEKPSTSPTMTSMALAPIVKKEDVMADVDLIEHYEDAKST